MGNMSFYYTPPGGVETSILGDNVFLAGMYGFRMGEYAPASERVASVQGETYTGEQPYAAPRKLTVSVYIQGTSWSAWDTNCETLADLVTPFKNRSRLGVLRIIKPNTLVRSIECLLISSEHDAGGSLGPWSTLHHLTFWAPNPFFYNPTKTTNAFGAALAYSYSGILAPVACPISCHPTINVVSCTVTYAGTAKCWPTFHVVGPCVRPKLWNVYTDADGNTAYDWVKLPFDLATGDTLDFDMETGTSTVTRSTDPTTETRRDMIIGSTRFQVDVGAPGFMISGQSLAASVSNTISFYERFAEL